MIDLPSDKTCARLQILSCTLSFSSQKPKGIYETYYMDDIFTIINLVKFGDAFSLKYM